MVQQHPRFHYWHWLLRGFNQLLELLIWQLFQIRLFPVCLSVLGHFAVNENWNLVAFWLFLASHQRTVWNSIKPGWLFYRRLVVQILSKPGGWRFKSILSHWSQSLLSLLYFHDASYIQHPFCLSLYLLGEENVGWFGLFQPELSLVLVIMVVLSNFYRVSFMIVHVIFLDDTSKLIHFQISANV